MRCPKCGYISFDNLQNCKKCKKDVTQASSELNGTINNSTSPLFLQYAFEEDAGDVAVMDPPEIDEIPVEIPIGDQDLAVEDEIEEISLDMDMDMDTEEPIVEAKQVLDEAKDEDIIMDLDDLEELAPRDEFTLDIENDGADEEQVEAAAAPEIDFSDIDISDLAPPSESQPELVDAVEELEPVAALSDIPSPAPKVSTAGVSDSFGLEDLQLDDLDLDSPANPVMGSAANQKITPSVKTGTALDTFEIDLGELFAEKKE